MASTGALLGCAAAHICAARVNVGDERLKAGKPTQIAEGEQQLYFLKINEDERETVAYVEILPTPFVCVQTFLVFLFSLDNHCLFSSDTPDTFRSGKTPDRSI